MTIQEDSLALHEKLKGKLEVKSKIKLLTKQDFSLAYTPGVAEPSRKIAEDKENAYKYTIKGNTIAVISNGTAVLGLGNIGATAAIPVMEGKAAIFKELAGLNAFPICIDSEDVQENINIIRKISPVFGGINLEDYKAPECFEIESALQNLGIPVMHDDQHGTAIVVLAGLLNALKVANKKKEDVKTVVSGAGAAALAVSNLLIDSGFNKEKMILCDTKGAIYEGRETFQDNKYKLDIAKKTNKSKISGNLEEAIKSADIFIGLSKPALLTKEMAKTMNKDAIIFAMANPTPEIMPDEAKLAGALVIATGRSDFPNQVNNALVFPGIFLGALKARATRITKEMKLAAATALANMIKSPTKDEILPAITDRKVPKVIAKAVIKAWMKNKA